MFKMKSLLIALTFVLSFSSMAVAKDHGEMKAIETGDLKISKAWSRATPANARAGAGYAMIENKGDVEEVLVEARSDISEIVELHEMNMNDGVMTMRPIEGGLVIPAGGSLELKPGGFHVMFVGLESGLSEGDVVPVTLIFANAGEVDVNFKVKKMGASMKHDHKH